MVYRKLITYTERQDRNHLYARVDFEDATYIEVPIHGVAAEDIQEKLRAEVEMHKWLVENVPID